MMNNYFHDVATAMLLASGSVLWLMLRKYEAHGDNAAGRYFLDIYLRMTKVARFSLYWILIGGIPRTLTFRSFEWSNAVSHGQIPALILKQAIAFGVVAAGVFVWLGLNSRVKLIRQRLAA